MCACFYHGLAEISLLLFWLLFVCMIPILCCLENIPTVCCLRWQLLLAAASGGLPVGATLVLERRRRRLRSTAIEISGNCECVAKRTNQKQLWQHAAHLWRSTDISFKTYITFLFFHLEKYTKFDSVLPYRQYKQSVFVV